MSGAAGQTVTPFGSASPGGKGGGQTQAASYANTTPMGVMQPAQPMTQGFPGAERGPDGRPVTQPAQPNVFQQAAGAQQQAQQTLGGLANMQFQPMQAASRGPVATFGGAQLGPAATMGAAQLGPAATMQGVGQVADMSAPGQIGVNQLATTDLGAYMSPYQQQVIEQGQADIERQRQMASNTLGAQAQAAGAFGGSRQAVQEGVLAGEALRQAAQLSAQQRQRGFETALQSGQFDIGQMQAARSLASQQEMQANTLNQQAAEAAAAREQAARSGNMAAANQFASQQAQFEQQARQLNMSAQNAMAQAQAQLSQQAGLANVGAINAAQEAQAAREQAARQATFGGQFQVAGQRAGAAGQLAGLGQQMFGQGQSITQQQQAFGQQQQALNQALLDAARGQYGGFVGAPQQSLGLPMQAVSAGNMGQQTQTQSYSPGLFDYLSLGATALATPFTGPAGATTLAGRMFG